MCICSKTFDLNKVDENVYILYYTNFFYECVALVYTCFVVLRLLILLTTPLYIYIFNVFAVNIFPCECNTDVRVNFNKYSKSVLGDYLEFRKKRK